MLRVTFKKKFSCGAGGTRVASAGMNTMWLGAIALMALLGCATPDEVVVATFPAAAPATAAPVAVPATVLPVERPPAAAEPTFYDGLAATHWVTKVLDHGAQVQLEDGSLWAIAPAHRPNTMIWLVGQKITVTEPAGAAFPYRLTNTERNATVEANFVTEP